jgi:hypothetical protein
MRVNGLRLTEDLVHLRMHLPIPDGDAAFVALLRLLANRRISLPYVATQQGRGSGLHSLCLHQADWGKAGHALTRLTVEPDIRFGVGMVTLFPHGSSLRFVGGIYALFGEQGIPLYGSTTSLSALSLLTDSDRLDRVVDALLSVLVLPANHTPFRPEFKIRQVAS